MELLVVDHHPATSLARFADVLDARTELVAYRRIDVRDVDAVDGIDLDEVGGILVMGGPQSVADGADHPWLAAELGLLRRAVDADVPVLAVCLGAQVLALAGGGQVSRLPVPEVGFLPLRRTEATGDEEVTAGWPDGAPALLLHEDAVTTLPPDAVALLDGPAGPVAWRLGSAIATQAHHEVDAEQLTAWVHHDSLSGLLDAAEVDREALAAEAVARERFTRPLGQALLGRFVDGPVRRRVTGSNR